MEVTVVPGPNTRSPVFQQAVYEVTVSEGAAINSTVATIQVIQYYYYFIFMYVLSVNSFVDKLTKKINDYKRQY